MNYEWDENKRQINLQKHGLDFVIACQIYESPDKLTISSDYEGETRELDLAPVGDELLVLTLVYTYRGENVRIISLRKASRKERRLYYEARKNY